MADTLVPNVTFGERGFVVPSPDAVLVGVQGDINAAFGRNLNYKLTTPQGQIASSEAAVINDNYALFVYYTNQVDPAFATGRMQDAIARIYFLTRLPAEPTSLQIQCFGGLDVVIPLGASVVDSAGNVYLAVETAAIPSEGFITLPFAAQIAGPTPVPDAVSIYQTVAGWDSATVVSGAVGQNTESRSQFEARRRQSVAKNAVGILDAILGSVLEVPGVLDAYVIENDEPSLQYVNGVTLAPNSIYVAVVGGAPSDVAEAIWRKKAPGAVYNGNTSVTVQDTNAGYSPPLPSYVVKFETPAALPILFSVVLTGGPGVPADAATQVRAAIMAAFNGEDGGTRARIGSTIYSSRYVTPVVLLGDWVQLESLAVGSFNDPDAVIVASLAGTTLTVTSIQAGGALAAGQTLLGSTLALTVDTEIVSQLTGTTGGIGTYEVSKSQTVISQTIKASDADHTTVNVQIDQVPTLASDNILVTVVGP